MAQYTYSVKDARGMVIMANGWGMYIDADTMAEARAKAEAEFLAPMPVEPEGTIGAEFITRITKRRSDAVRDGYSILVRRRH